MSEFLAMLPLPGPVRIALTMSWFVISLVLSVLVIIVAVILLYRGIGKGYRFLFPPEKLDPGKPTEEKPCFPAVATCNDDGTVRIGRTII
jgi:hypothetical protein